MSERGPGAVDADPPERPAPTRSAAPAPKPGPPPAATPGPPPDTAIDAMIDDVELRTSEMLARLKSKLPHGRDHADRDHADRDHAE
jgi:hypothetical protein